MKPSKAAMLRYIAVQKSGVCNMLSSEVSSLADISADEHRYIIAHYSELCEEYQVSVDDPVEPDVSSEIVNNAIPTVRIFIHDGVIDSVQANSAFESLSPCVEIIDFDREDGDREAYEKLCTDEKFHAYSNVNIDHLADEPLDSLADGLNWYCKREMKAGRCAPDSCEFCPVNELAMHVEDEMSDAE